MLDAADGADGKFSFEQSSLYTTSLVPRLLTCFLSAPLKGTLQEGSEAAFPARSSRRDTVELVNKVSEWLAGWAWLVAHSA